MVQKPKSARAIIIKDNKILLMHRIKYGRDFYTLIGGSLNKNEIPLNALIREVKEETSLDVIEPEFLFELEDELRYAYYYLVKKFKGTLQLNGPEKKRNCSENQYILEWIPYNQFEKINLIRNPELKKRILKLIKS